MPRLAVRPPGHREPRRHLASRAAVPVNGGPPEGHVSRPGRIRGLGPLVALSVPAGLVAAASAILALWPCEGACARPYGAAWLLVLMAFPTALAAGLPWIVNPLTVGVALGTSVAGWLAFGAWAGRRATEEVDATWRTYWRELGLMAGGVAAGVLVGLGAIATYFVLL